MQEGMKQHMGVWFPAHEQHMCDWISERMRRHPEELVDGKGTYQYHKLLSAMKWVKNFRVAVDVGAHVGLWSMHLAKRFEHVHAFEPVKLHRQCFMENVPPPTNTNTTLYPIALGEAAGMVNIATTKGSSGDTKVVKGEGSTTLKRLDDIFDEGSADHDKVDFVKVDCEGYEIFVLRGGAELLQRCKPCVIVEQKPGFARRFDAPETGAVSYLQEMGAVLRKEIGGDFILSWD
jgi:FkbM family methyltransferase